MIIPTLVPRTAQIVRPIVMWCPDWPVFAAIAEGASSEFPLAVVDKGTIFACSEPARDEGVIRGQRVREAQGRCPNLVVIPHDSARDARVFEPVIEALEDIVPDVHVVRPGMCAVRARGPARYYGSEQAAARILHACLLSHGVTIARLGIADGLFAAEHAARSSKDEMVTIIPPGESPQFLAPLPLSVLDDPELTSLLERLGIHSLGDCAALSEEDMLDRFGERGIVARRLACGLDSREVIPRIPPRNLGRTVTFESALEQVEQVAFSFRTAAEEFIDEVTRNLLVCTGIRIEVEAESGAALSRTWLHPRFFTAVDVVDRIRWQLQGSGASHAGVESPIVSVRVEPETVDDLSNHHRPLWGSGKDEKVHHGLSRVQSIVGHDGVVTARIGGGRNLSDRQIVTPWGEKPQRDITAADPWPGHLPSPRPTTVFPTLQAVSVCEEDGDPVLVNERGTLSGEPALFSPPPGDTRRLERITTWAGPWSINERWWNDNDHCHTYRFQVVDARGIAWLVRLDITGDQQRWWAEGRYD